MITSSSGVESGYFWPIMEEDCGNFFRRCLNCQKHGNIYKAPPTKLHNLVFPWPFSQWGIDVVGPFLIGKAQKKFVLVTIDILLSG